MPVSPLKEEEVITIIVISIITLKQSCSPGGIVVG